MPDCRCAASANCGHARRRRRPLHPSASPRSSRPPVRPAPEPRERARRAAPAGRATNRIQLEKTVFTCRNQSCGAVGDVRRRDQGRRPGAAVPLPAMRRTQLSRALRSRRRHGRLRADGRPPLPRRCQ
jgi:hypothetical protein